MWALIIALTPSPLAEPLPPTKNTQGLVMIKIHLDVNEHGNEHEHGALTTNINALFAYVLFDLVLAKRFESLLLKALYKIKFIISINSVFLPHAQCFLIQSK